ncbi:unnamed protein product [Linum tenue]|uniref:Uncharacterized protein n=1 Tax=Linum tenue TaxID=586396 RepID=A0AAV0M9X3_9ROSI|nr:unnamed protein product [Linum tenue]
MYYMRGDYGDGTETLQPISTHPRHFLCEYYPYQPQNLSIRELFSLTGSKSRRVGYPRLRVQLQSSNCHHAYSWLQFKVGPKRGIVMGSDNMVWRGNDDI